MRKCGMCKHDKPDECFAKPGGGFFKLCEECREYSREYGKWYRATFPERRQEIVARSRVKYRASERGKAVEKAWRQSESGRASRARARAKYRATEHGKTVERASARRRGERYKRKYAVKIRARNAISNGLRDKRIEKPLHCQICGRVAKLHAHHHHGWAKEYHYNVWWLCKHCDPPMGSPLPHDGSLTLEQAKELLNPSPGG